MYLPPLKQRGWIRLALALVLLGVCGTAAAQPAHEDAPDASLRLGPVWLAPRLAIRNIGVDTNVFNNADAPVRDLTATGGPEVDSWFRLGRIEWAGRSSVAWNYFRDTESQRSFDLGQNGRVRLDLGRVRPFVRAAISRSRQRLNLEIDARVRWQTAERSGGLEVLLGPKTTLTVEHGLRDFKFDEATLVGSSLSEALDRTETTTTARGRYVLTPLTTMVVTADVRADRFRVSTGRDSDSVRVTGGLELRPLALVAGRAVMGVREFTPRSSAIPAFTGTVADVELSYQLRDLTRLIWLLQRDVDYSFEASQAYYVSTGTRLSAVQALGGGWDVVAHVGRTALGYQARVDSDSTERGRTDRVLVYGGGVGRRFGTELRIGMELEYGTRTSNVRVRSYKGLRGGGTVSYGF